MPEPGVQEAIRALRWTWRRQEGDRGAWLCQGARRRQRRAAGDVSADPPPSAKIPVDGVVLGERIPGLTDQCADGPEVDARSRARTRRRQLMSNDTIAKRQLPLPRRQVGHRLRAGLRSVKLVTASTQRTQDAGTTAAGRQGITSGWS